MKNLIHLLKKYDYIERNDSISFIKKVEIFNKLVIQKDQLFELSEEVIYNKSVFT